MAFDDDVVRTDPDLELAELEQQAAHHHAARRRIRRAYQQIEQAERACGQWPPVLDADARRDDAHRELIAALNDCPHAYMQAAAGWNREHPDAAIPPGTVKCLDECGQVIADPLS